MTEKTQIIPQLDFMILSLRQIFEGKFNMGTTKDHEGLFTDFVWSFISLLEEHPNFPEMPKPKTKEKMQLYIEALFENPDREPLFKIISKTTEVGGFFSEVFFTLAERIEPKTP